MDILKRMKEHYEYLLEDAKRNNYEIVALFLQGSQNYGLDEYSEDYTSDVDTKAIVLPSFNDFILGKEPVSKTIILDERKDETSVVEQGEHIDVKDIRVMFNMFKKANISYIELLFSKYCIVNPKYMSVIEELLNIKEEIIDYPRLFKTIYGMTLEKRKALCHPYPTTKWKIDKWGYDGKQLSHLMRLYFMLCDIKDKRLLDVNTFIVKDEYRDNLITVKKNMAHYTVEDAIKIADEFCEWTKELTDEMLQEEWQVPDMNKLDNLLIKTLRQHFKEDILNGEF